MLSRGFRLRKATDFSRTYKLGKSYNNPALYIKAIESKASVTRIAVVVPKKVSKKAVDRNRDRRRIYEICRSEWDQIKPGYNIIITGKISLETLKPAELKNIIFQGFKYLGIQKG